MIYLASPYSHPEAIIREQRYLSALRALSIFQQQGIAVYSPIAHWHQCVVNFKLATDAASWRKQNYPMQRMCSELYVLCIDGWFESVGVNDELNFAGLIDQPISYASFGKNLKYLISHDTPPKHDLTGVSIR